MANDVFLMDMGLRIAQRRKELHMTQEQLAEKVGISLQTVSCIELGKKAVRPENLAKLCTALQVSADYILYGRRSEQQMNEVVAKLAALTPEQYQAVRKVIELLEEKI